jgi:hypothetical protein
VAGRVGFEWLPGDTTIHLVEPSSVGNPDYAMNTSIDSFQVASVPKGDAAMQLFARPEFVDREFYVTHLIYERIGSEQVATLDAQSTTARAVLNELAEAGAPAYWTLYHDGANNWFAFRPKARTASQAAVAAEIGEFRLDEAAVDEALKRLNDVSQVSINADLVVQPGMRLSLSASHVTLGELLTQVCEPLQAHWFLSGGCINVVDADTGLLPESPMNAALDSFAVEETRKGDAALDLFARPELLELGATVTFEHLDRAAGPPERKLTVQVAEATPRFVLNALVVADDASYWTLLTEGPTSTFAFGDR